MHLVVLLYVQRGAEMKMPNKIIIKAVSRKKLTPLFLSYSITQTRKERSDFAAVEFWRRGWRPRQPVSGSCEDWIFTKLSGGTKRANAVRPYHALCGYQGLGDKQ